METIRLTPKVVISNKEEKYFILTDGENFGYTESEENAKFFLDSLASKLEDEVLEENGGVKYAKVFRTNDDNKVTISYQTLGLWNSQLYTAHILEYVKIYQLFKV